MEQIIQDNKLSYIRSNLFEIWLKLGQTMSDKNNSLQNEILASFDEDLLQNHKREIIKNLSRFCSDLSKKWEECNRTKSRFLKNNKLWLQSELVLLIEEGRKETLEGPPTSRAGRPVLPFEESSDRTKRRKTEQLRKTSNIAELGFAITSNLREAGKLDAAKIINEVLETSPTRATKIRKAWLDVSKKPISCYSPEEALSLLIEAKLTKHQYTKIRLQAKEKNADIYPAYNKIRAAKNECYPDAGSIIITDLVAEVHLQELLDHTAKRIILTQAEVIRTVQSIDIGNELTLIVKWGCDGSTGHSEYKQKLPEDCTDTDMFISSLVPVQLFSSKVDKTKLILWQNPRPSSVRYCRPIKIQYKKETTELVQQEIRNVQEQINKLIPLKVKTENKEFIIKYDMVMTMIDGKICSAAMSTSTQICYICKATPKEMNQIDRIVHKTVDPTSFKFGLSTLHAWIRFLECVLHISYRLPFKKWQARGEDKNILNIRKLEVQKNIKEKMSILVDQVKPGGSGTSNDGNTARRFFKDPAVAAETTGVSEDLIRHFGIILRALSSGYKINATKFAEFTKKTAKLYIELYAWYYMPASIHKILMHGPEIIDFAILPIGQLSEEAQECRNRDLKMYRRSHTRKISRETTNEDLLHALLVSSDPYISGLRKLPKKTGKPLPPEVLDMLIEPEISAAEESDESYSEDQSSDGSDVENMY